LLEVELAANLLDDLIDLRVLEIDVVRATLGSRARVPDLILVSLLDTRRPARDVGIEVPLAQAAQLDGEVERRGGNGDAQLLQGIGEDDRHLLAALVPLVEKDVELEWRLLP